MIIVVQPHIIWLTGHTTFFQVLFNYYGIAYSTRHRCKVAQCDSFPTFTSHGSGLFVSLFNETLLIEIIIMTWEGNHQSYRALYWWQSQPRFKPWVSTALWYSVSPVTNLKNDMLETQPLALLCSAIWGYSLVCCQVNKTDTNLLTNNEYHFSEIIHTISI
jgi:hypothetical protein